jgi:hypothetical protein
MVAMTAEVEDQRDLVGAVLLRLDPGAIDGGEELRARRLGEDERVLRLHAAQADDDVANARRVGRRELERPLRGQSQLAARRDQDANRLRRRRAGPARYAERERAGRNAQAATEAGNARQASASAARGLHGDSSSTRRVVTPSRFRVSRARATASGEPMRIVPRAPAASIFAERSEKCVPGPRTACGISSR